MYEELIERHAHRAAAMTTEGDAAAALEALRQERDELLATLRSVWMRSDKSLVVRCAYCQALVHTGNGNGGGGRCKHDPQCVVGRAFRKAEGR